MSRYRQRCGGRRGGLIINSANAKPIAPAINIEPSGLSCTFFAIACEAVTGKCRHCSHKRLWRS